MRITSKTDPALIHQELAGIRAEFLRGIELDLKLAAKRTAFYMMEYTLPTSAGNPFMIQNLQKRIWSDVHTVYPSVGDAGWQAKAFKVMKDSGELKKGQQFWENHIMNQGYHSTISKVTGREIARIIKDDNKPRPTDEEAFAKIRGIPRKTDDKGYGAILRSKGSVRNKTWSLNPLDVRPAAIVSQAASAKLAKQRQKKAGLAKAAWYQSVHALGGIRNFTRSASEEGIFKWPKECVTLHKAYPGIGSSAVTITDNIQKITLTNHLRYTDHACPPQLVAKAEALAETAMRMIFEKRAKAKQSNAAASAARLSARRAA